MKWSLLALPHMHFVIIKNFLITKFECITYFKFAKLRPIWNTQSTNWNPLNYIRQLDNPHDDNKRHIPANRRGPLPSFYQNWTHYNKPFISFLQMSFSGRLNGGNHGGQGHQTETGNGNNVVPLSICSHNLDGDDQNKLSLPFGITQHMFSRILNLQIYQKKFMKYSLFCFSMR